MPMIEQMDWSTRRVLGNDTSAISTLRCLKLYLERLGCNFLDQESVQLLSGELSQAAAWCLCSPGCIVC